MDYNSFRLYPRGFLGNHLSPEIEKTAKNDYVLNNHNSSTDAITANNEIEKLYAQYIKNSVYTSTAEFRKQVLLAAINAFGTPNFLSWYVSQFSSPSLGDLHNRFLTDTMRFINSGRRDLSLESWDTIINISTDGNSGEFNPTNARHFANAHIVIKDFFGLNNYEEITNAQKNTKVTEVIRNWCAKQGGFEDMLGTLHILFGSK